MGHQHHFLSRLDRVSLPHVEIALLLYRDEQMLQSILKAAKMPENAERLAISLDDPKEGPFLIVTREGRFVTCLGEGMSPGPHPVMTRVQLDAAIGRTEEMRNRIALAEKLLAENRGGQKKLFARIFEAGPRLSRDEFKQIAVFQPLLPLDIFRTYLKCAMTLEDIRDRIFAIKAEKLKPIHNPMLRNYWITVWAQGHLAVLALMGMRDTLKNLPIPPEAQHYSFAWGAARQGIIMPALRGFWGVGKVGKMQMPQHKKMYDASPSPIQLINGAGGLFALGLRHSKLRAEARKVLETGPHEVSMAYPRELVTLVKSWIAMIFDEEETVRVLHRSMGATMAVNMTKTLPVGSPLRFKRHEDVPEDFAMCLPMVAQESFLDYKHGLFALMCQIPYAVQAEPEEFFLPKEYSEIISLRWQPSVTMEMLNPLREMYYPKTGPVQRTGPSRKGPCPCGSGKKYKRCCGEGKPDMPDSKQEDADAEEEESAKLSGDAEGLADYSPKRPFSDIA